MNDWNLLNDAKTVREALDGLKDDDTLYVGYLRKLLENEPEITRCADCEYFERYDYFGMRIMFCKRINEIPHIKVDSGYCYMVTENSFCAWGRRKDE